MSNKRHKIENKKDYEIESNKIKNDGWRISLKTVWLEKILDHTWMMTRVVIILLAVFLPFLSMLLHEAAKWMLRTWNHLSMEELVAQLKTPIKGTNHEVIWDFIKTCIPPAIAAISFVVILIVIVRKTRITKWVVQVGAIASSVLLTVSSVQLVWTELDVGTYLREQAASSYFIEEHYADPSQIQITFPEQKRNLIYIFMESMEATYASEDVGGGFPYNAIPELSQLAMENVNFSNSELVGGLYPTTGATWTMGAMVGQTSGLPLKLNLRSENVNGDIEILPGATTIGDILQEQGYRQEILFGSEGEFAGRKQYFEQHGNYKVMDYIYAKENGWIPSDYRAWWGYEDAKLFEFAKARLQELSSSSQPFNLTMLTVDTHFEDGYLCELCEDTFDDQYSNVMACSSRQIYEFINWVKEQPFYENTTIVLVGDHLTMDSDFCENVSEDYQRGVMNVIINAPVTPINSKNRTATTLDMFPTTIAALGAAIEGDRLGMGTNLFSSTPTLAEEVGLETVNSEIRQNSTFYNTLIGNEVVDESVMD